MWWSHFENHLGNKLYDNIYKHDMIALIGDFYLRSNSVIANFNMCDSVTLNNIHSSLYGIELFNVTSSYMTDLYIAWRKVIRHIYRLPNRTHNFIIVKLGGGGHRLDRRLNLYLLW